jgi:hypothetical protein
MTNKDAIEDALDFLNYIGLGRRLAKMAWKEIAENLPVHRQLSDEERDLVADTITAEFTETLSGLSLSAQDDARDDEP